MSVTWVRCGNCGDYFCTLHQLHVGDCPCPTLEELLTLGVDPYSVEDSDGGIRSTTDNRE